MSRWTGADGTYRGLRRVRVTGVLVTWTAMLGLVPGCSKSAKTDEAAGQRLPAADASAPTSNRVKLRVTRAKQLNALAVLEKQGGLERALAPLGASVEWLEFAAGPQQLEALNAGALDVAHTAESPALFAQAAGGEMVYLAATHQNGKLVSLITQKSSSARRLADLKGQRIAVQKASIGHYLLVRALQRENLPQNTVETVFLPPPDANAAFARESVAAWFIWEPFVTRNVQGGQARVLFDGEALRDTRNFYTTRRSFAQRHPQVLRVFLEELQRAEAWSAEHRTEMSQLLSSTLGIDVPTLEIMHDKSRFGVLPITDQYMDEQQRTAELWLSLKLLPHPVNPREARLAEGELREAIPLSLLQAKN